MNKTKLEKQLTPSKRQIKEFTKAVNSKPYRKRQNHGKEGLCYECNNNKKRTDGRWGGYNHKDCRHGKKDKNGKLQKCKCWCVRARKSRKYKVQFAGTMT